MGTIQIGQIPCLTVGIVLVLINNKMQKTLNCQVTGKGKNKPTPSLPHLKKQFLELKEIITPETASSPTLIRKKSGETLKKYEMVTKLKELNIDQSYKDFFTLCEKIGEGAHSVVYRCIQKATGAQKAIKLTKRKDEELINGMRECYHIMRELDHPSIVKGQYLFLNEQVVACQMITEFFPYPNLGSYILQTKKRGQKISEEIVAEIMSSLLNCVVYLHDHGVCHRDIKPDNILYDPVTGEIKLIDFEISRMQRYEGEKLDLWTNTGDLHYRAPQSFNGGYSEEIDMWSAGVLAYELLTGELPFDGNSDFHTMRLIKECKIDYESLNISAGAKIFLKKLLVRDPKQRVSPREALSCPFILRNLPMTIKTSDESHLNSSFSSHEDHHSEMEEEHKFYDQDNHFRFGDILFEDIGVRVCH